jgi:hypothetical protein
MEMLFSNENRFAYQIEDFTQIFDDLMICRFFGKTIPLTVLQYLCTQHPKSLVLNHLIIKSSNQ